MHEPLIYGTIDEYSATRFIENINKYKPEDNIRVRVNSDGGEVRYGWGMINKLSEVKGKKTLCNDGEANSMAAFTFCYAEDGEAHTDAKFMFHRAGFSKWYESNPELFTDNDRQYISAINASLRKALESKVNAEMFRTITGLSFDELFSMNGRPEAWLTADQAKACGLINRVTPLNISAKAEIKKMAMAYGGKMPAEANHQQENQNKNKMTVEQLQSEHPTVYAQIFNTGKAAGVAEKKDHIEACLVYHDADPKGVIEALKSDKPLSAKQMAEFTMKTIMAGKVREIEVEAAPEVITDAAKLATNAKAEAEKKAMEEFVAGVKENSTFFKNNK